MTDPSMTKTPDLGDYYAPQDYAGLFRRFLNIVIDLGVTAIAAMIILAAAGAIDPGPLQGHPPRVFFVFAAFCFGYFVLLESSAIGTLGFRLCGVRIATLKGSRPSVLRMTFRLMLWILGPINALMDLYWLTGDDYKQTLRDKLAGTVVVRRDAGPAGTGEIRLNRYQFWGHSFVFYEVQKPTQG